MGQTWKRRASHPSTLLWLEFRTLSTLSNCETAGKAGNHTTALCPGRKENEFGRAGQSLTQLISYNKEHEIPAQSKSTHQTSAGDMSSQESLQEDKPSAVPQAANKPKALL